MFSFDDLTLSRVLGWPPPVVTELDPDDVIVQG